MNSVALDSSKAERRTPFTRMLMEPNASGRTPAAAPAADEGEASADAARTREDLLRYDAWATELATRRTGLAASARRANWLFVVAAVALVGLWFLSPWAALVTAGVFVVLGTTLRYLILIYRWDYALQIERTQADARELKRLRADPARRELPQDGDDGVRARYTKRRIPRQAVMRMPWQKR